MHPFMDIQGLTPRLGRLKCMWVRGANGRLESVWVPDWERDCDVTVVNSQAPTPLRSALPRSGR
jgi:hypothetical protein